MSIDLEAIKARAEAATPELAAEVTPGPDLNRSPVRLVLDDLLTILRDAGWTDHKTIQL